MSDCEDHHEHRRRRQGGWGAAALLTSEKFSKVSHIIGQEIGLKSGNIFVNNGSFIEQPPKF